MDEILRLLAIISAPVGMVVGWKLSPYFISSLDEFVHSSYEIWLKKLGISFAWGFVPAYLLWNLGSGEIFNKYGHFADMPANVVAAHNSEKTSSTTSIVNEMMTSAISSSVSIDGNSLESRGTSEQVNNAVPAELNVDKIIAEKKASLVRLYPTCSEIFRQQELNPGENELACSQLEFAVADKELNSVYKMVRANLPAERKAALKSEQIIWIKNKESDCQDAPDRALAMGARFREAATNLCLAEITRKRTEYLKHY